MIATAALSITARVAYRAEVAASPLSVQHRWAESDMAYFDDWGRLVASGDLLSRSLRPPGHAWHRAVALDYLGRHPEDPARATADPVASLWERWIGGGRLYQEPLYAYLIALVRPWGGVAAVLVVQLALGLASTLAILWLTRRLFGDLAAGIAGLLAALCAPLLYLEMVLVRETAIVFASLGLVALADAAIRRGGAWRRLALGLATGVAILLKSHFALFAAGAVTLVALRERARPREAFRAVATVALGLALGLAPLVARNLVVGAPPLVTSSAGAVNFVLGNAAGPSADPTVRRARHVADILEKTRGAFLPTVVETLRTHDDAAGYLRLLRAKWRATWGWYEEPDNTNFYYYRLHARVLGWMPVSFLVVAPLALAGIAVALPRARACLPLLLMAAASLAVPLLAFPVDRFRAPFLALLIPFAAFALARACAWAGDGRWARLAALVAGVALVAAWVGQPRGAKPLIRPVDYRVPHETWYGPLADEAEARADYERAASVLASSLPFEPPEVGDMARGRGARDPLEAESARFFGGVRRRLAGLLERSGRADEARLQATAADALDRAAEGWGGAP